MKRALLATMIAVAASADRSPPAEMKLWSAGDNPTDFGVHRWTQRSVTEVSAAYEERGNPLLLDVEHGGGKRSDGQPSVTAGYAKLEIRGGEPWLVFDWSDYGLEQIKTGQRRFLSPEYDVDKKTGEIVRLVRVSLVADPATHRARMLASAGGPGATTMDPKTLIAALRAVLETSDDPKKAIASLLEQLEEGAGEPEVAASENGEPPPAVEAGAAPPEPEPTAAAAPEGDKPPPVASAKPEETEPTRASAPTPTETVQAAATSDAGVKAAAAVAAQLDEFRRDQLLRDEGHRLPDGVRVWASSQPFAVVQGIVEAFPAAVSPPARVRATRGRPTTSHATDGLQGAELAEFYKAVGRGTKAEMERFAASAMHTDSEDEAGPHVRSDGTLRISGSAIDWVRQENERITAARAGGGNRG